MAPGQASGKKNDLGPAGDVYGSGAMLYELLTGRPPFKSDTHLDTILHVLEREPVPPRLLNPKIDRDLETICLKCLEKDPRNRYESAEALADDLDRFIKGDSISARSVNVLDRLARTLERSQYDIEFHVYARLCFWIAGIVGLSHVGVFALTYQGPPYPFFGLFMVRVAQFGLMGLVYLHQRPSQWLPASAAERQLWSIWIGYLVASFCAVFVGRLMETEKNPFDELALFPVWALLAGVAFFAMGGAYWGWCYALGIAFFLSAILMPFYLSLSPLIVGGLWACTLTAMGWHLRRLGIEHEQSKPQNDD